MHQQLCTHLGDLALDLSHAAPLRNRHAERRPVQHRHAQRDLGDVAMAVITSLHYLGFALPRTCSAGPEPGTGHWFIEVPRMRMH